MGNVRLTNLTTGSTEHDYVKKINFDESIDKFPEVIV